MTPVPASRFLPTTKAVFETSDDPVVVDMSDIQALIAAAPQAPQRRTRLLLHPDQSDSLHEMVIALPQDSCDHPHINFRSGKSFLALSGQFAVMICSKDGQAINPIVLSADDSWAGARMVRLRKPVWHTIIPLAGDTVFLETISGPFEGNQFADWFPQANMPQHNTAADRMRKLAQDAAKSLVKS